jgi:hypothetical protein
MRTKKVKAIAALVAFPIIGGMVVLASVLITIMPFFFLRIHLIQAVIFQYNSNNAQQALNTLLYLTKVDTTDGQVKQVSKIIGRYVSVQSPRPDISFLKTELDGMVTNGIFKCYTLRSVTVGVLAQGSCTPSGNYKSFVTVATSGTPDQVVLIVE